MISIEKRIALTCVLLTCCLLLISCKKSSQDELLLPSDTQVYADFYPIYAMLELVTADIPQLRAHCLIQAQDGCLRDYSLSDWDLALIMQSDILFIGGNGLESFDSVLTALGEYGPVVASVGSVEDMITMPNDLDTIDPDSHWSGINPHCYMSTDGIKSIATGIAATLSLIDSEHAALYTDNLNAALERIDMLKAEMYSLVGETGNIPVVVLNEALVYAVQEYGLDAVSYFGRESGEELDDARLANCLEAVRESGARIALIEQQAPKSFCDALRAEGLELVRMDTLSTRHEKEGAEAYFEAMLYNANALGTAIKNLSMEDA